MEPIDLAIKQYLENKRASGGLDGVRLRMAVPSDEDFYLYIRGELDEQAAGRIQAYLQANTEDAAFVAKMRQLLTENEQLQKLDVPDQWVKQAKSMIKTDRRGAVCPHCLKPITPFKQSLAKQQKTSHLLLAGAVFCFGLSFVFPRYFIQCLVAGAFFGFKWIVDRQKVKTQIMIYKALTQEGEVSPNDLHPLKSRL
jgi:hypothetical protein